MLKFQFHLQDRARRGCSQHSNPSEGRGHGPQLPLLLQSRANASRQEKILTGAGNTSAFKLFIKLNQALNNGKT